MYGDVKGGMVKSRRTWEMEVVYCSMMKSDDMFVLKRVTNVLLDLSSWRGRRWHV